MVTVITETQMAPPKQIPHKEIQKVMMRKSPLCATEVSQQPRRDRK